MISSPATDSLNPLHIGGYFLPEVARQVRILAAEQDTTIQLLAAEALNHLFVAYGKP